MNTKPAMSNNQGSGTVFGHAVVIGSSIAGLTMARVLTDHFARVTIIERDRLSDTPEFRRSVPQARPQWAHQCRSTSSRTGNRCAWSALNDL